MSFLILVILVVFVLFASMSRLSYVDSVDSSGVTVRPIIGSPRTITWDTVRSPIRISSAAFLTFAEVCYLHGAKGGFAKRTVAAIPRSLSMSYFTSLVPPGVEVVDWSFPKK